MTLLHTKEFPPTPPQDHVLGSKVKVPESVQGPGPEKIPALLPPPHWQRRLGLEGGDTPGVCALLTTSRARLLSSLSMGSLVHLDHCSQCPVTQQKGPRSLQ